MKKSLRVPHWVLLGEALAMLLALNSVSSYLALTHHTVRVEVRRAALREPRAVLLDAAEFRSVDAGEAAARIEGERAAVEPLRRTMAINALAASGMLAVLAAIGWRIRSNDAGGDLA